MALEPETLPRSHRPARSTSTVRFEAEAGALVRQARLFEDGQLASESLRPCPVDSPRARSAPDARN